VREKGNHKPNRKKRVKRLIKAETQKEMGNRQKTTNIKGQRKGKQRSRF
jgi:hypothetical protein